MTDIIQYNPNRIITPEPGLLLEGIQPIRKEEHRSGKVFVYRHEMIPKSKGIIYPGSEILTLDKEYNVFIDNVTQKSFTKKAEFGTVTSQGYLLHSHVFHDFDNGDEFSVQVESYSNQGDPMIRIQGYLGFIKDPKIKPGDSVRVRVKSNKPSRKNPNQRILILSTLERL